ncbi:MAG: hypothetical protein IK131_09835, partial [Paludibacteraceae bacterium]|nr:hypothetical protein [Paludibacteraceae bacterium]
EEEGFWLVEFVKFLFYGPEKSTKPLTFGVCLRRFFIVLDNLIAAALVFYVLTWIKFYSNGADTSFDVIIDDMLILCINNVQGFFLIILATWRWFCYSDSLPCLKNFTYLRPYVICVGLIAIFSFCYFMYWLRLLIACRFDIDAMSKPVLGKTFEEDHLFDYLPYWAQEIRIVILGFVFMIRRLMLNDVDMDDIKKN